MKFNAFTLAEVLITLGIIGVIAALTIPTIVSNHRKHIVETKLARFYSTIQQAIKLAEAEYGERENWDEMGNSCQYKDEDAEIPECINGTETALIWFNKYLAKYIKTIKTKTSIVDNMVSVWIYFPDGSLLTACSNGWNYYINEKDRLEYDKAPQYPEFGKYRFAFRYDNKNGLRPNTLYDSGDCAPDKRGVSCLALIYKNGWKIPKDYPLKF